MTTILVKLFEHNLWANLRAAEACGALTDAQLDATVPGTAGTVRETLMHIAGAEQRYVHRLANRQPTFNERDGWPGAERLTAELRVSGQSLIDLAANAEADTMLNVDYQGRAYQMPTSTLYVQAINHATEHRSHIATILTQQGVEPPDFQAWSWQAPREPA